MSKFQIAILGLLVAIACSIFALLGTMMFVYYQNGQQIASPITEEVVGTPASTQMPVLVTPSASQKPLTPNEIFSRVSPSVAFVDTPVGTGSGILTNGGYLVTNAHVVWPFDTVRVVFPNGLEFAEAPVLGWDLIADLAVIGPLDTTIKPVELVDSEATIIGSDVYLIGYPAEVEDFPQPTISRGLISRLRQWHPINMTFFQTDASIAGGQSGGVLVSETGDVIGISGFRIGEGEFGLVASAVNVVDRVQQLINGQDIDGLGPRRLLTKNGVKKHEFSLTHNWDTELYVINEPENTEVEITVRGENDVILAIMDTSGDLIAYANDRNVGDESVGITTEFEAPYFVIVFANSQKEADYEIISTHNLIPYHDMDDNKTLELGQTFVGNIDLPNDVDYFNIELEEGQTIAITVDSLLIDALVGASYWEDQENEFVADDNSGGGFFGVNAELIYQAAYSGKHLIVVEDASGYDTGGYYLNVEIAPNDAIAAKPDRAAAPVDSPYGEMRSFELSPYPYSFLYPADWELNTGDNPICRLVTACYTNENGSILAIAIEDLSQIGLNDMSHERYVDLVLSTIGTGFEVLSQETTSIQQGVSAEVIEISMQGGLLQGQRFIYLHAGNIGINISYITNGTHYDELKPLIQYSFNSFKLIEPNEAMEDPDFYIDQAATFLSSGEADQALKILTKAIELDPEHSGAYWKRATAYSQKNNYDGALADMEKAIEFDPENAELYHFRAFIYWMQSDFDNALSDLDKALALDNEYDDAYNMRSLVHTMLGEYDKALADINQALDLRPVGRGNADLLDTRGFVYIKLGEYDKARADFEAIFDQGLSFSYAQLGGGITYAALGESDKASELLEAGLKGAQDIEHPGPQLAELITLAEQIRSEYAPTVTPVEILNFDSLDFRVIDAEYSLALDRIIIVSDNPDQLHIYDPATQNTTSVDLQRPPTSVSVGPDGRFAAVGHDAKISYVDLENGQVIKTLDVTTDVFDVILAGNGWIYASPRRDQWEKLRAVEIATNNETQSEGNSIRAGTVYKLHPDGQSLYGADRGLSPSDIEKIDISQGTPVYAYDSPYHGDYGMCGNLWMSEDGQRIFTACGNVFRASLDREQDMTYNGSLSRLNRIQHVVHSNKAGRVLAIPIENDFDDEGLAENQLVIYGYETLNTEDIVTLPDVMVNNEPYAAYGRFVFVNNAGTQYYVIVQADEAFGLLNDFGVITSEFSPSTSNNNTQNNTAPVVQQPSSDIEDPLSSSSDIEGPLVQFEFRVVDAEYSQTLDRIITVSENPNQLHIYDPHTHVDTVVELSRVPTSVSVGPDGKFAAVGHDAKISYIDLQTGQVVDILDITARVSDVVLADNGWVYAVSDQQLSYAIEIETNNQVQADSSFHSPNLRLHPDGQSIYATRSGSPGDVQKIDISQGTPGGYYDSPYHGDHPVCHNLWLSEDGQRIFTACGSVFRASSDRDQDMTYNGSLSRLNRIQYVVHSRIAERILAIPQSSDYSHYEGLKGNQLVIFGYENLNTEEIVTLPDFKVNNEPYAAEGRFVFVNAAGNQYYVIVQADEASGLLNDFGVVTAEFSPSTSNNNTQNNTAPVVQQPSSDVEGPLVQLEFRAVDAEYSQTLDRIVIVSENPNQLHIYDPHTYVDTIVQLSRVPTSVSVGPDGKFAAVGHDAKISHINLQTGQVVDTLDITTRVNDVVLAGNGWAYAISQEGELYGVEIETNNQTHIDSLFGGIIIKLHPDGQNLYSADRSSDQDLEKIDISAGSANRDDVYGMLDHDYKACKNLWFSEDGKRIFTACGAVFRASSVREHDMRYNGSLTDMKFIQHVVHAQARNQVLVLSRQREHSSPDDLQLNQLFIYGYETLNLEQTIPLPDYNVNNQLFTANGRFVFTNPANSHYYVIVQADENSGLHNDFGFIVNEFSATEANSTTTQSDTKPPFDGPIIPFNWQVVDAEYNLSLDRIIMVSDNPNQLHIYDPKTQADTTVNLPQSPLNVSVGPDGKFAAVGHDFQVSYIDLQTAQIIKVLDTTAIAADVVLANNGWIYVSSISDNDIRAIEISTNLELKKHIAHVNDNSRYKLHPNGQSVYVANRHVSPTDLINIDISKGDQISGYDSPYHGNYAVCGDLWMSEDGKRIFTACGNIFTASSVKNQDMNYDGNLSRLENIQYVVHSNTAGRILAIPKALRHNSDEGLSENQLVIFDYKNLNTEELVTLPDFVVNNKPYAGYGRFVFVNAAGKQYYVIVQADEASGLLNDFGLVISGF